MRPSGADARQQETGASSAIVQAKEQDPGSVQPKSKGKEVSVSPTKPRRRPYAQRADDVLLDPDLKSVSPSQCMQGSQRRVRQSANEHREELNVVCQNVSPSGRCAQYSRSSTEELILRESLNQLEVPLQCPVIMCDKLFHFRDDFEYHKAVCIRRFDDKKLIVFDMVISRRTVDSDSISMTMAPLPSLIPRQTNLVKTYPTERSCAKIVEIVSVADTGLPTTSRDTRIAQNHRRLTQLCWHTSRQTSNCSTK